MNLYKSTHNLYSIVQSMIDPDDVKDFTYTKNAIFFLTNKFLIRIAFDDQQGRATSAIRFRDDAPYNESTPVRLENYDSSTYFNVTMNVAINLSMEEVDKIVNECKELYKKYELKTYIIIESKVR